jgi:predicted ATPase
MALDEVEIRGFKSHRDTKINLGKITVLVGPNGVGKSSALEALDAIANMPGEGWHSLGNGPLVQGWRKSSEVVDVAVRGKAAQQVPFLGEHIPGLLPWMLRFEAAPKNGRSEPKVTWMHGPSETSLAVPRRNGRVVDLIPQFTLGTVPQSIHLRLSAAALARPASIHIDVMRPKLESDGSGLAAILSELKLFQPLVYEAIIEELRVVVPSVRNIRLAQVQWSEQRYDEHSGSSDWMDVSGAEVRFDFVGAEDIPARQASEGTILALGALVAIRLGNAPRLVLLDDIEHGLHPKAQRVFIKVIRSLLESAEGVQFVLTSHSPYIVDSFEMDEVVVMGARSDGSAVARRLSEHPNAQRAREVLSTGEFLAAEQEEWVASEASHG